MFDWVSAEFSPFIGVAALGIVFLAMASLIQKYRGWQAEKMLRAQALLRSTALLEQAERQLQGIAVPAEIAAFCREEMRLRYAKVKELFPDMEGLDERMEQAGRGMGRESANWDPPALDNVEALLAYTNALTGVIEFLSTQRPLTEMEPEQARSLRERLRTLRAEAQYAYHYPRIAEKAAGEQWEPARKQAIRLMGFLKAKAPPNERGRALYQQTLELYHHLEHRRLPEAIRQHLSDDASAGVNAA